MCHACAACTIGQGAWRKKHGMHLYWRFSPGNILAAIQADGLTTPAQIGARLKAGTNCGSCIPELKKLLQSVPALNVAE